MCLASLDRVDFGLLCCVWSAVFVTATQFDNYRHNQHELPKNNQHQHGQTDNYPFGSLSNQRRKQSIQYAITDGHEKLNYEGRNFDPNEETNSPVPS
jgi:hypothetical protein